MNVKADSLGTIRVQVTNAWLSRPKYEQKQMKQIIGLLLKKIVAPKGWDFYIVDYMGNTL